MKTKNIHQKAFFAILLAVVLFGGFVSANNNAMSFYPAGDASCAVSFEECSDAGSLIDNTIIIFLALILWSFSPVGILFFLAFSALISRRSSRIKRTIAWIAQILAFFTWLSFMTLFLLAFLDSIFYNIFNLGGTALELAIISGFGFFFVMFIIAHIEKGVEREIAVERESSRKKNDNCKDERNNNDEKDKEDEGSIKFAGIEFCGMKDKIRKKIKQDIKEIIDDVIDKKL